jgi:proteasome lid subunit RPN8/RPN11
VDSAWKKILGKLQKREEFVVEQIYQSLPENSPLVREFCYIPGEMFQVYIHRNALKDVHKHALDGLKDGKEVAGVLMGRHLFDDKYNVEFIEILDVVQVQSSRSTSVDVNIPANEWGRIQVYVENSTNYKIVGWYHSHPRMKAFMSSVDRSTQLDHFNHSGQVAIVVGVGNGISEVKCFDHFSNEVNLYFLPQENDKRLISANLEVLQNQRASVFSRKSIEPIKYNISAVDKIFEHVFKNYELDQNFSLLGFDSPKGHIQGFDRLYPELRLGIEYYIGLGDDAIVLRSIKNEFIVFAINVNELNLSKVISIVQAIYSSILEHSKDYSVPHRELYRKIIGEFEVALKHLRKQQPY